MSTDQLTSTETPTQLELAGKQIGLAKEEHTAARLATSEKEKEFSAVILGIRDADHTTDADELAAMIAKEPALNIIVRRLRVVEREAEGRVRDAENNYERLERHISELRDSIAATPKQESQIKRKQLAADNAIREAQAARASLEQDHQTHTKWRVAELRRHTRRDVE